MQSRLSGGRLAGLLLILLACAFIGAYWGRVAIDIVDEPDPPGAATIEPEYYRFAKGHNYDFFQYYAAGHNWSLGLNPYVNHPGVAEAIPHPRHEDKTRSGYIYPPTWLPVFALFARLPYDTARHAWFVLTVAMLLASLATAATLSRGRGLLVFGAGLLLALASCPLLYHFHQGQADLVVSGLSVIAFVLYGKWRSWPTATLLAAAITLKLTPAVLVLAMALFFRDWRLPFRVLAASTGIIAASVLVMPAALYWQYVTDTLLAITAPPTSLHNQSLSRLWAGYPTVVSSLQVIGLAMILGVSWLSGRDNASQPGGRLPTSLSASSLLLFTTVAWLAVSPLSWQMGYVAVIAPLALVLTGDVPRGGPISVLALGLSAVFMSWNTDLPSAPVLDSVNLIGAVLAAVTLLLGYLPLPLQLVGGHTADRAPSGL